MRTGLVVFGVIFLVIGGLLYFVPMQVFKADTTTVDNDSIDTYTSSAEITVPIGWAIASAIIGLILLVLGLAIPNITIKKEHSDMKRSENKNNGGNQNGKRKN